MAKIKRQNKLDLNLADETKYNILYKNVVANGMPELAAEQIVAELRKRGLSPFPNIFKVPNVRAKIAICYLDRTFVAQAAGLEFLGLTNFEVVKSGQKINIKIDRQ